MNKYPDTMMVSAWMDRIDKLEKMIDKAIDEMMYFHENFDMEYVMNGKVLKSREEFREWLEDE